MTTLSKKRFTIRITVGFLFLCALFLTALTVFTIQYRSTKAREQQQVIKQFNQSALSVSQALSSFDKSGTTILEFCSYIQEKIESDPFNPLIISVYAQAMMRRPHIYSIFSARPNDEFVQLINVLTAEHRERQHTPAHCRWVWITQHIEANEPVMTRHYLDERLAVIKTESAPSRFYPTQRNWYLGAQEEPIHKTSPYLFYFRQVTGQTYAKHIASAGLTVGVDVTLEPISEHLDNYFSAFPKPDQLEAYLFQSNGQIIAETGEMRTASILPRIPQMSLSKEEQQLVEASVAINISNQSHWAPIDFTVSGTPNGYVIDLFRLVSQQTGLSFNYINGLNWSDLVTNYQKGKIDILQSVAVDGANELEGHAGTILYELPLAILGPRGFEDQGLTKQSGLRIGLIKDWSIFELLSTTYPQHKFIPFDSLEEAVEHLKAGEVDGILDLGPVLRHKAKQYFLNDYHLSFIKLPQFTSKFTYLIQERFSKLKPLLDRAIQHVKKHADSSLYQKWLAKGANLKATGYVPYAEIMEQVTNPQEQLRAVTIAGEDQYLFCSRLTVSDRQYLAILIPGSVIMDPVNNALLQLTLAFLLILVLLPPTAYFFGRPISHPITQLRLEAKKIAHHQYGEVAVMNSRIKEVYELSMGLKSVAEALATYEKEQELFMESLIELIAGAIDEKSPYTGGHCKRVPRLGLMIAAAAEAAEQGHFASFQFANETERREFRIAAWLHDCGKITIPEYVVDKGTKLETNYNRIHEVRTRFEVLWRDAQIEALNEQIAAPQNLVVTQERLAARYRELTEQFEFIARANVGGEYMDEADINRVKRIGAQTWQRHFNDRLGLSPLNQMKWPNTEASLPQTECLLADKPEHIIERDQPLVLDPALGIKMEIPEKLYNRGEIYNLTIQRGTLTAEERFKINEHMINGIKILSRIPLPKELARIPRYASTHHETLIGTGYPRKLRAEDLSIPERILAVADIFEALTAADRPYKKAKSLSMALDILYKMAAEQHVDYEVFKLFVERGVYLDYAHKFLDASQIDAVDVDKYLKRPDTLN